MIVDLTINVRTAITSSAVLAILMSLLLEDRIWGYGKKRLLPGTEKAVVVFTENGYSSTTYIGKSEWQYDKILLISETEELFVFIFSKCHAQLYDKRHL